MKRISGTVSMALIASILAMSPLGSWAACYKQNIVTITPGQCTDCHGYPSPVCDAPTPNVSGAYGVCAEVCPGDPGKVQCIDNGTVTMTTYACEIDWNVSAIISCAISSGLCGFQCGICIADPTKLSCIPCAGCLIALGVGCVGCDVVDDCVRVVSGSYPQAHKSVTGAACTG